ncbi:MAG: DMT family transporter, partial [Devosia sp.]|jgi:drug/metabolite transporter (DMT)-like permease
MSGTTTNLSGARIGDNLGLGMALTVLAILIFGVQDAVSKILVQDYSPFQVVMLRYWAFAIFSLFLALRQGPLRQALKSRFPLLQTLRGMLLIADIWMFGTAVRTVPLAELQAISLVYPLIVTIIAVPILGERVGLFRIGAVLVGFAGALVILRPGGLPIDAGVLFALGSAAAYAVYIVLTRRVALFDSTSTSMLFAGLVGFVLSTAIGVFFWKPMTPGAMGLMAVLMVTMILAHGMMMKALSLAPASLLQPFNYLALPWGITLSFLVFGHLIDPISLVGAGIIAVAGLVVMARERRRAVHPIGAVQVPGPHE